MLVLTRFVEERIAVTHNGEELQIVVVGCAKWSRGRFKVRIGLEGPQSFQIVRDNAGNKEPNEKRGGELREEPKA